MWLLTFALLLFAAVLLSCRARETVLSTSVLFLGAGIVIGHFTRPSEGGREVLYQLAEVTLFAVLFSDGMRTSGFSSLRGNWRPTGRILFGGMAGFIAVVALCSRLLLGVDWTHSFLIGAVLAPTDPVFVSAIFGVKQVSDATKAVLNLESGFNDGLALPAVLLLMSTIGGHESPLQVFGELILGLVIGVVIPFAAIKLEQTRIFGAAGVFERLHAFAIGLLILATARIAHANEFLAAFSGGITVVTLNSKVYQAFEDFGEVVTEVLKLATLLVFGMRVSGIFLQWHSWRELLFTFLAVLLIRPLVVLAVTVGTPLPLLDRIIIGWFGPKGFASVVYGLMILRLATPDAETSAHVVGVAVVFSIVFFSSTDVLIGRWITKSQGEPRLERQEHA